MLLNGLIWHITGIVMRKPHGDVIDSIECGHLHILLHIIIVISGGTTEDGESICSL